MHSKSVLHFKIKSHPFIDDLLCTFYTYSIELQKWGEREGRVCVINGTWNAKSKLGAVTVKRKLSVRETAEVIRKSHLKKKIRPWLSSYVTNLKIRNGAQIATKETRGLKMWSIQKDNNSDPLWSSHHTCRLQMRFPTISFFVWDLDDMSVQYDVWGILYIGHLWWL